MFAGDPASIVGTFLFTAAELTFARYGHTRWGYSLGAAAFAAGDFLVALSPSVAANENLQTMLFGMAAAWAIGVVRAPLAAAAFYVKNPNVQKVMTRVADGVQPVVGSLILLQRIPGIVAAFHGGNRLVGTAMLLWGVSDVLTGRVHKAVGSAKNYISRKMFGTSSAPQGPQ